MTITVSRLQHLTTAHEEMRDEVSQCLIDAANEMRDSFTKENVERILTDIARAICKASALPSLNVKVVTEATTAVGEKVW